MIRNGENGLLADEGAKSFASALEKLIVNKELRIKMGSMAKKNMTDFAPEKIWDKWENLLNSYNR